MSKCKYLHDDKYCWGQKDAPEVECSGDTNACESLYRTAYTYPAKQENKNDMVNHPAHYTAGGIECIDALAAATTGLDGIEAVCTANAIKYLWRWKYKNGKEDLEKAKWYINHLIEELDKTSQ